MNRRICLGDNAKGGQINQELQSRLENLKHELFRTQEQLRRKSEVQAELKENITTLEETSHQQVTALCSKINTLENDVNAVDDEEMLREWRRCQLNLDRLVKRHFKDTAKLGDVDFIPMLEFIGATITDSESLLGDSKHQLWAIIQAFMAKILSNSIFLRFHPGLEENQSNLFHELDQAIRAQCAYMNARRATITTLTISFLASLNTWRHCKSGINLALSSITQSTLMLRVDELVNYFDQILGAYVSGERSVWRQQLQATFALCVEFKSKCSEQPQDYYFDTSHPGEATDSKRMKAAGMIDCLDQPVALSLWPSLWKEGVEVGNPLCLERELVWLKPA